MKNIKIVRNYLSTSGKNDILMEYDIGPSDQTVNTAYYSKLDPGLHVRHYRDVVSLISYVYYFLEMINFELKSIVTSLWVKHSNDTMTLVLASPKMCEG